MPPCAEHLCLQCGLCCNGVIFADGQLQPGDDPVRLAGLGLKLKIQRARAAPQPKFSQPCAAFCGGKCGIYRDRPSYCRKFECGLLKRVLAGERTAEQAVRTIASAKRRAAKVEHLLQELGDERADLPLATRFRRMSRRIHGGDLDELRADAFGDLTIAAHELAVLLSAEFYPGS